MIKFFYKIKIVLLIKLLLTYKVGFSQIKAVIIDSETKEKIPYVNIWVLNKEHGTTSNKMGEFELRVDKQEFIFFSAIGFESREIKSDSIKEIVEMTPSVKVLDEVIVKPTREEEKLTIGTFKKSAINHYFASSTLPWVTARFFPFKNEYRKTPFLEKVRIHTNSDIKESKFNLRLYRLNDYGEPEDYLYNKNIIGIAKKGNRLTEIDLSELSIEFPEKGFFIAIEWLIIDENKFEYTATIQGSKKKLNKISYEPAIGTIPSETDENSWVYSGGDWKKIWKNGNEMSGRYKEKYSLLAIELTLTN